MGSRALHVGDAGLPADAGPSTSISDALALAGVAAVAALLLYEHSLVRANDLSRVDAAFFTMNGCVSVLFFRFWAADIFFLKSGI